TVATTTSAVTYQWCFGPTPRPAPEVSAIEHRVSTAGRDQLRREAPGRPHRHRPYTARPPKASRATRPRKAASASDRYASAQLLRGVGLRQQLARHAVGCAARPAEQPPRELRAAEVERS